MDYLVQFKDNDPKKSHLLLPLTKQSVAKFKITDIDASDIFPSIFKFAWLWNLITYLNIVTYK